MSILGSLQSSTNALLAFERALATVQNNVSNVSTPGYARQVIGLEAEPFLPEQGLPGGVSSGERLSARDEYLEQLVRRRQGEWGRFDQTAASLSRLEAVFDVSGEVGIPLALSRLFQSFSALSVAPNDAVARGNVIEAAGQVARSFRETAAGLGHAAADAARETAAAAGKVNRLAAQLREYSVRLGQEWTASRDPALEAAVHTTLEELSGIVDVHALRQDDGTLMVLLGGQTPLVIGDRQYEITADFSSGQARILNAAGDDVTEQAGAGRLAGLLRLNNELLPAWTADLDRLASSLAGQVNQTLTGGQDVNGNPGAALFAYDPDHPASSLAASDITPAQIAAAGTDGVNANALRLAALATTGRVDDTSYTVFYAGIAARPGRELSGARENRDAQRLLLAQARTLREETTGVSLDEEAAKLIQFQRSYQAAARLVAVLDEMTETVIGLLR